jgi:hypothetical protein
MYPVELFVARDVLYGAKQGGGTIANLGEIDDLVVGGIALFADNGSIILAATTAASLKNVSQFRIAINDGNGVRLSAPIDREAYNATKQGYVAAVKQVVVVGESSTTNGDMNYPTTLVPGTVAELVITDTTTADYRVNLTKRYYAEVTAASTAATLNAALIAAINADPTSIVVASAQGTVGIILTAKLFATTFVVGVTEIIESATIWKDGTNGSVIFNPGRGNVSQLLELQTESDILLGKSNFAGQQQYWWSRQDEVAASGITGFEMFIFQDASEARKAGKVMNVATKDTVLAYPTGTTATTGIEDVLTGILAVVLKGAESSSGSSTDSDN